MTGLMKGTQYDWKDSNLALFGSDIDKAVKLESAETEPAWHGVGEEPELRVWRIEKFEVKTWPKVDYGKFYDGDSYIVLHTYKDDNGDDLNYDIHFWIGRHSSQDEYGTAAYKTVELDTYLNDAAVQHREVMGHETAIFKSYFDRLIIMSGGADSGFRRVVQEDYRCRLMKFNKAVKSVEISEIPRALSLLSSDDVFVLDCGLKAFQWNGKKANKDEKYKAALYQSVLEDERGSVKWQVLDEGDEEEEFFSNLDEEDEEDEDDDELEKAVFKVSADFGEPVFREVARGEISKDCLESGDVFVIATEQGVCVWIGSGASAIEKKNGLSYAHEYLRKRNICKKQVTVLKEGQREEQLNEFFV